MSKLSKLARALRRGRTVRFTIPAGHDTCLFEATPHHLHAYTGCCGARLTRHQARQLHRLLGAWLDQRG